MESLPELQNLFEKLSLSLYGDRTYTENLAGAFTTTGDKCLDFFATIVRSTSVTEVVEAFVAAWNEDPEKAIKLLLNLRDIRGGKGEKKVALVLLYALSCWKPLTYLANLQRFIKMGCYKDLLFLSEMSIRCEDLPTFKRIAHMDAESVELKIMACQLVNDERDLAANPKAGISLCAKWAPTENTHYDQKPLRLARKINKAMGIKRSEYRKNLTKLRAHLNVLEQLIATEKWDEIVFKSLPAKAHRLYRTAFHREENRKKVKSDARVKLAARYKEYLEQLTKGETTIKSTGTEPHELILPYMRDGRETPDLTIEGQWKDLISKLTEGGKFSRTQAICDVSGSMDGIPMQVAIAMGLVVAELTEPPFANQLITFSAEPMLHTVKGTTLMDRVKDVQAMDWGGNTNLIKVFELLLEKAKSTPNAEMVEKLFIFSDMQFDQASATEGAWETTYDTILKMYGKTRFAVPKIIFWNLRATHKAFPVKKDEIGTAMMSGFSAQMLKTFLTGDLAEFNPVAVMNEALEKYEITEIPKHERVPVTLNEEELAKVDELVEQFMVAKKVSKKRKRTGGRVVVGPAGDHSESGSDDDDESGDGDMGSA